MVLLNPPVLTIKIYSEIDARNRRGFGLASRQCFDETVIHNNETIVNIIECTGVTFPRRLGGESDGTSHPDVDRD
jgi:hypothetical protein